MGIAQELIPLVVRHHNEVEPPDIKLDVAWDELLRLNALGFLRVLTIRDGGVLIGYIFTTIRPCLWAKTTLQGYIDSYFLEPAYREGWTAYRAFKENDRQLRDLKLKRVYVAAEAVYKSGRAGVLFRRLGYRKCSDAYAKIMR